jgi:hypothetical protein
VYDCFGVLPAWLFGHSEERAPHVERSPELGVAYCLILSVLRETTERARKVLIPQMETSRVTA